MTLSATDLAIAAADDRGTLSFFERFSRFGDLYVAITDEQGTIEVADSIADAKARVASIREALIA
jgi:hypothetical protein